MALFVYKLLFHQLCVVSHSNSVALITANNQRKHKETLFSNSVSLLILSFLDLVFERFFFSLVIVVVAGIYLRQADDILIRCISSICWSAPCTRRASGTSVRCSTGRQHTDTIATLSPRTRNGSRTRTSRRTPLRRNRHKILQVITRAAILTNGLKTLRGSCPTAMRAMAGCSSPANSAPT